MVLNKVEKHYIEFVEDNMKRDMDLIRQLLLYIEENTKPNQDPFDVKDLEGYTQEQIDYHLFLLQEAGLIKFLMLNAGAYKLKPIRLTWEGHEFLDNAKNETVWSKTKQLVKERGGTISFEVTKTILTEVAKKLLLGS